ncbi:MAG: hypothetical protein EOP05_02945 [Proteobacteria bacterium]|nr:MAG: hypothetical protein EOP05_02945 [Pseudomonadota bacterium]
MKQSSSNSRAIDQLKLIARKKFVITKDDVPQSYFESQVALARERGHGTIALTESIKEQMREQVIADQEHSLDRWVEYLSSSEAAVYPIWTRYWMLAGVTKLSKFQPESSSFATRSKQTIAPFPELNAEALSYVVAALVNKIQANTNQQLGDKDLEKLLDSGNFGKSYAFALIKAGSGPGTFRTNRGQWRRFDKGSSHLPLVQSLEGRNTGWCTAVAATAAAQLANGDFHVFYSYDEHDRPTVPRIAIRMEDKEIGEIRGVGANQNLDAQIQNSDVLTTKMMDFKISGEKYAKRDSDMKLLTQINQKSNLNIALSRSELRFLYEIDSTINGFGHQKDPRIEELKKARLTYEDAAVMFSQPYKKSEVSSGRAMSKATLDTGRVKVRFGEINLLKIGMGDGLVRLPPVVIGDVYVPSGDVSKIVLPEFLRGRIAFPTLKTAKGLQLPSDFKGSLELRNLESAEGLKLPDEFEGDLFLSFVSSASGLNLPKKFSGTLALSRISDPVGLRLPIEFYGDLLLVGLKTAEGLALPEKLNGTVYLSGLASARGLRIPTGFRGEVSLQRLTDASELRLPENFDGVLTLGTTRGLTLPKSFRGTLRVLSRGVESIDPKPFMR